MQPCIFTTDGILAPLLLSLRLAPKQIIVLAENLFIVSLTYITEQAEQLQK